MDKTASIRDLEHCIERMGDERDTFHRCSTDRPSVLRQSRSSKACQRALPKISHSTVQKCNKLRQRVPPSPQQLRETNNTAKQPRFMDTQPGPRYCHTPESKNLEEKLLKNRKLKEKERKWIDDEESARQEKEKYFVTGDGERTYRKCHEG